MSRLLVIVMSCAVLTANLANAQSMLDDWNADEPSLYTEEVGQGDTVIVVVHGGPGVSHDYLRPEWDRLATQGYRVVYYDQRGCGRSDDGAPYTWRADVDDLRRVIALVSKESPVVLAGSSWGSWLALLYAMEHPREIRALILSGTPPWWHKPTSSYSAELIRRIRRLQAQRQMNDEAIYAAQRADSINRGLVPVRRVQLDSAAALTRMPPEDSLLAYRLARPPQLECRDAHAARVPLWFDVAPIDSLRTISTPTLLVWGSEDRMLEGDAREISDHLPFSKVQVMKGRGHDPWFETPEPFFAIVERFLRYGQ